MSKRTRIGKLLSCTSAISALTVDSKTTGVEQEMLAMATSEVSAFEEAVLDIDRAVAERDILSS